jgi:multidrug resistance efflux pump
MKRLSQHIFNETGYRAKSVEDIYFVRSVHTIRYWSYGIIGFLLLALFLPWTQNINANGAVTTLYQDQRPQQLNTIIPGRIVKWYVREGNYVQKGDTIVQLLDIKDDYLDPNLVKRTEEQLNAKKQKADLSRDKAMATQNQIVAIENARELKLNSLQNKLEQLNRKVISDSAALVASEIDHSIAQVQLTRAKQMYSEGIIPLTELERRTAQYNKALAYMTEKSQTLKNTRQDLVICRIEISTVVQDAADKIFKARAEIASAMGDAASTDAEVAKNQNQLANYIIRGGQRWLIAPQSGQITKARKAGLNETVKEGDMIVEIVPDKVNYAVELFIDPMDLVLISKGQEVRMIFDGYPAVVFSGWPNASYGTFQGTVAAVETNRSENGKFRMLIIPNEKDKPWPKELKLGAGVQGFALLKNVRVWFELWRQINGFPPEYYRPTVTKTNSKP